VGRSVRTGDQEESVGGCGLAVELVVDDGVGGYRHWGVSSLGQERNLKEDAGNKQTSTSSA
jgi:hypothetical protein